MATIVTRAGKGVPLTNTEVDANFTNLDTDKLEAGDALGTPASVTLTNATGLPTAGLVDNAVTDPKLRDSAGLSVMGRGANSTGDPADIVAGTNKQVLRREGSSLAFGAVDLSSNQAVTGTLPVNQGGTGITSFGTGVAAFLGTPSSANLAAAVTDETGTGALVFANSPTLVTPALGTPASGVVTNLTGTASININGTVGATTPAAGAFTTLSATSPATFQAGTAALPSITTSGDTNTGLFFPAADTIAAAVGGSEAMRLTTTGLGIGTSAPAAEARLHVVGGRSLFDAPNEFTTRLSLSGVVGGFIGTSGANTLNFYNGVGIERLRIDSAGNVGIGTTAPNATYGAKLACVAVATQAAISIDVASGTNTAINYFNAGVIKWSTQVLTTGEYRFFDFTASAERLRIDTSGNVGIGVVPSATGGVFKALQIANGAALQGQTNSISVVHVTGNTFFDADNIARYIASGEAAQSYRGLDGAHNWFTAPSGTAGNAITFTQAMTLDASGNLLVGTTTSSGAKLDVVNANPSGNTKIAITTNPGGNPASTLELLTSGSSVDANLRAVINAVSDGNSMLAFQINSVEQARFGTHGFLRMASGTGGIQFNGDTAAANALDDYEQGTWTPVLRGDGTAGTYETTGVTANYTKVGNKVTLNAFIALAGVITGGGTGDLQITGTPFTSGAGLFVGGASLSGVSYTGDYVSVTWAGDSGGQTNLYLRVTTNNAGAGFVPVSGVAATDVIAFTITYFV